MISRIFCSCLFPIVFSHLLAQQQAHLDDIESIGSEDGTSLTVHHNDVRRGVLIGIGVCLSTIVLLAALYLLFHFRRRTLRQLRSIERSNTVPIPVPLREQPQSTMIFGRRSDGIRTSAPLIEELMHKSLQLAQTAERVADEKEKRISLKDRFNIDLELAQQQY